MSRTDMAAWQRRHRACVECVAAGYIAAAQPVFSGVAGQRIMLVGQAPGITEVDAHRPFAGRAGRELMRWFVAAGFADEDDVRAQIYMTSMTTCYPGRARSGGGDRRPSAKEVGLCSQWLNGDLERIQPRLIIPIGTLSLTRFLPRRRLEEVVGHVFSETGVRIDGVPSQAPVLLPLPHPSGQSRWNNDAAHRRARDSALQRLAELRTWANA